MLALLFVLFAIKPDTAHAEDTPLASVEYTSYVATKGWLSSVNSGTSGTLSTENQMEAFRIKLNNQDYTGDIQYEAHVTTNGWMGAVQNDAIAGTTGDNLAIQAIKMQLTGEMANHYDIYYRANVSTMGWLGWAKNNELAGGTGFSLPILGYEVKLIRKGDPTPEVKENYPSYLVNDFTAKIANINNENGTYDVIVDTKTSPVKEVKIPTWTANNGGDDIVWHVATKQSDGTYKYTVKSSEHKYESGTYSTHVYMYSSAGQADRSMALPDVQLKPELKSKITTDTKNIYITITGADPYKLTPTTAVWSDKNGQDDLKWYDGTSIKVPISSHSGYGNYRVDVYYRGINNALMGVSTNTIKTSENAVNLLDEGKWFPYNQKLQIFKDADTSRNRLEAINKPSDAYWSLGNQQLVLQRPEDMNNLQVKAYYYNAGQYDGKKLDIVVTFKNFNPRNDNVWRRGFNRWFVLAEKNIYNGFFISGSWYTEVDIEFYEAGTNNLIDMNAENAFVSTNSINHGEYTTYLNSTDNNRIYFMSNNNLIRINANDLTAINNWGIWSNRGYYPLLFGGMQSSIGISDNFTDYLYGKTFKRNSAVYRLTGKTHRFIFGTNYSDIWATFSSAVFNVRATPPEKTVTDVFNDSDGKLNDLTDKKITQGTTVIYHVKQKVGQLGVSLINKYETFKMEDALDKKLEYQKAELYINDKLSTEGTNLIQYDEATNKVVFNADDNFIANHMPFNGETYDLRIYVKGHGTNDDPEPTISNTANVTINNENTPSNTSTNKYVGNTISVTADDIVIDTSPVSSHQFDATIKVSQEYSTTEVFNTAQYKLIIDEKNADGTQIKEAYSTLISANNLQPEYKIKLPFSTTKKSEKVNYVVRFESQTPDIKFSANELSSYGVTASERVVSEHTNEVSDVVRTTRSKDDDKTTQLSETYTFDYVKSTDAKSGYGVPTDLKLTYTTEAPDLKPKDIDISSPSILQLKTDVNLLNKDSLVPYTINDSSGYVKLVKTEAKYDETTKKTILKYQYPHVYSKENSGQVVLESQREESSVYKDGGNKLYIPIWATIKPYSLLYTTIEPIGINQYTIKIDTKLNVYAQMHATYDSKTLKYDELNLLPVLPDDFEKSGEWSDADTKWVKQSLNDDWKGTKYTFIDGKWVKK